VTDLVGARRTRVKICGTTSVADALLAEEAGADAVGLIFAESRRRVDAEVARTVSLSLGPAVARVGVFLNAPLDVVLRTADRARLSAVQLHGDVEELYLETLLRYHPVLRVVRTARDGPPLRPGLTWMLDAPSPGSGVPLDWASLEGSFPEGAWLAGGLGPHNVAEAMRRLGPVGVDAVSRLESSPGVKDRAQVLAFVAAVRNQDLMSEV
jgi:phosphoribosylanthranilate isomerase